jgi:hypothetical protein
MTKSIKKTLTDLTATILETYKAFNHGYAYAKLLDNGMCVQADDRGEMKWVSINDISGNYFYIRVATDILSEKVASFSDCANAIQESYPCVLIAVYKDGDEFEIKDALTALLLSQKYRVRKQSVDRVAILAGEMKGLKKEVIASAISRIKNMTIVRVEFDVLRNFQAQSCKTYSLCKEC